MNPPEPIETDRLLLRPTTPSDTIAVFEYQSDVEVTRHLTFPPATDPQQASDFLERCARVWSEQQAFPLALTLRESNRMIGMIEPRPTEHGIEVGYVLRRSAWNNGYMTEALRAVADWALDQPDVFRVWAHVDTDNVASQRVLEKAGFTAEGLLHRWAHHTNLSPEPRDALMFAKWR